MCNENNTLIKKEDNCELENIQDLKKENQEIKTQLSELKDLLQKALKIHPRTLQKINKQLNNTNIKNKLGEVYGFMVEVGKDIARGIWTGLSSMTNWFKLLLTGWVNANIPAAVRNILKISSPSKVMEEIGQFAVQGLYKGMGATGPVGIQLPQINVGGSGAGAGVVINISAGTGTDPHSVGRAVQQALNRYTTISK